MKNRYQRLLPAVLVQMNHTLTRSWFRRCAGPLVAMLLVVVALAPSVFAQTSAGPSQPLITQTIDESNLVVLSGNTRPEAKNAANDRGIVADSLPLPHMMLQLRRPAAQEQALDTLIDQLHDRKSPNFHHWLSGSEIGAQFGPAASDIQAVTGWLAQQGFTVNRVYPNGMVIDYSGTAGQVRAAFHTEIHNLSVNGVAHIANMTDPQVPAALAPAVVGIVSLHDFRPTPASARRPSSQYTNGNGNYIVTPPDLATIYNFTPAFTAGITGRGQTITLIELSDAYSCPTTGPCATTCPITDPTCNDWAWFRATYGLNAVDASGTLTTVHPGDCTDPGVAGRAGETAIDMEYASAAAPGAAIVIASCKDTAVTNGNIIVMQNLLNVSMPALPPAIVSLSYEVCELKLGNAANYNIYQAYMTGAGGGASIYVAAGDWEAAQCDSGDVAISGISVSGYASTPYNVAVGGTDFSDTYEAVNGTYWSSTNMPNNGSALYYIPEIPWNDTCASQLLLMSFGPYFTNAYGMTGFCNSNNDHLSASGGSGGPSSCATIVMGSDTCRGYTKPTWQIVSGNPSDGLRDLPDVSMFASSAPWSHSYTVCFSDPNNSEGGTCSAGTGGWDGTSFGAPIWAGIQALVNQNIARLDPTKAGGQGNPNTMLYPLAHNEYAAGIGGCNSGIANANPTAAGNSPSSSCIFYDVTFGDNRAPCYTGSLNCYNSDGSNYGVLSTSNSPDTLAYSATTGWDFATGIGTVNVDNLVTGWPYNGFLLSDTHDTYGNGFSSVVWVNQCLVPDCDVAIWEVSAPPTMILQAVVLGSVPRTWSIIGQRDFTGRGNADLLWRDGEGDLAMWFINGVQVSSTAGLGNVPINWTVYGTGDLNADGKGDLLWRDSDSGTVVIWFMNGAQVSSMANLGPVPTNWSIIGDDNRGDILWRDTSGNLAIWHVSGSQVTQSVSLGNVPPNWAIAGIGDFNGDGFIDILWRDSETGTVAIWFMNSTLTVESTASLGAVPSTWSIAQTGDYNHDGKSDILWIDRSGNVAVWFMNAGKVASIAVLGSVGTTWAVQSLNAE